MKNFCDTNHTISYILNSSEKLLTLYNKNYINVQKADHPHKVYLQCVKEFQYRK